MSIREATTADIEALRNIRKRFQSSVLGNDSEEIGLPTIEEDVSNGNGCCLVYEVDGQIAGFIYAQHLKSDDKRTGRVYLSIKPEYEGNWYGLNLYRACETRLKVKGYSAIVFATTHGNRVIKWMGEKFGFEFSGTEGSLDFYKKSL